MTKRTLVLVGVVLVVVIVGGWLYLKAISPSLGH
jgi:hypothetical protein